MAQRFSAAINAFLSRALAPEVFHLERTRTFAISLLLIALAPSALFAQNARPSPTPISRSEVWQAVTTELRHRGVPEGQLLHAEEIDLPVSVPAAITRTLRVSMVCWDADLARAPGGPNSQLPAHDSGRRRRCPSGPGRNR